MSSPHEPMCLILNDGDLDDVCALLRSLGLAFFERRGRPEPVDEARAWDLVVSNPKRLLEFDAHASAATPVRIAILNEESRTLRAMLHRAGVDLIVRRPVHPSALRLLILHSLYRGPEKRRSLRVSVGARTRFRTGLRRHDGVLADLSVTGCRLLAARKLEQGRDLTIQLPADVTRGRPLSVKGRVVRTSSSELPGMNTVAVSFGRQPARIAERLRAAVAAHSTGPAVLNGAETTSPPTPRTAASDAGEASSPPQAAEPARPCDRRASPRHAYAEHVIALGVEAARVLLGRDISLGGMRVDAHPDVSVGDQLRIGLHLRAREQPLVVQARVVRDDAEDGLVLRFLDLSEAAEEYLRRMVHFLPIMAIRSEAGEGSGVIVSEILDHLAAIPEREDRAAT